VHRLRLEALGTNFIWGSWGARPGAHGGQLPPFPHDVTCCLALFAAAVRVEASSDVTVHVVSVSDWSTGSYVALPLDELGSDYYVMTFSSTNETRALWQMCVVSLVDNTVVQLNLGDRSSSMQLQPVNIGVDLHSATTIFLDKYQTFQVIGLYTV